MEATSQSGPGLVAADPEQVAHRISRGCHPVPVLPSKRKGFRGGVLRHVRPKRCPERQPQTWFRQPDKIREFIRHHRFESHFPSVGGSYSRRIKRMTGKIGPQVAMSVPALFRGALQYEADEVGGVAGDVAVVARVEAPSVVVTDQKTLRSLPAVASPQAGRLRHENGAIHVDADGELRPSDCLKSLACVLSSKRQELLVVHDQRLGLHQAATTSTILPLTRLQRPPLGYRPIRRNNRRPVGTYLRGPSRLLRVFGMCGIGGWDGPHHQRKMWGAGRKMHGTV